MQTFSGLKATFGCTPQALALYRIIVGALLLSELLLRFRFLHPFYADEGTLPLQILMPKVDNMYKLVCVHCLSGDLGFQQRLLHLQCLFAFGLMIGFQTRLMAISSWFLYFSLTLRNTWLNFILDRYFHYLLFYAMLLPLDQCWAVTRSKPPPPSSSSSSSSSPPLVLSWATMALKLQVTWIYFDAGFGKYSDPLGGWTYAADPLPALDTYARHTVAARYLYALLQPPGLRLLTPTVVYVELLSAPIALLASWWGWENVVKATVAIVCSLHIGIALTVRNTVLLSLVACAAWTVFLPFGCATTTTTNNNNNTRTTPGVVQGTINNNKNVVSPRWWTQQLHLLLIILPFVGGSIWFDTISAQCDQSMEHIWSALLHNRWNVFVGAEEYVTWEIAPGRLANGAVVDVWGRSSTVHWNMPGGGAPSTSTARPGRWRSFPYLAELKGEEGFALWNYLCQEWDREHEVHKGNPGLKLLRFNFFMLQADVLPNMGFSATRKRLIQEFECPDYSFIGGDADPNEPWEIERMAREKEELERMEVEGKLWEVEDEIGGGNEDGERRMDHGREIFPDGEELTNARDEL